MNSKPYFPHMGKLFDRLTSPIASTSVSRLATPDNLNRDIMAPRNVDKEPFSVSIELSNSTIFQKGLSHQEKKNSPHKPLQGNLLVYVFKPTQISKITVEFWGKKHTPYPPDRISFGESTSSLTSIQEETGKTRTVVHDTMLWKEDSILPVGIYNYAFTFMVDPSWPETVSTRKLKIKYYLETSVKYTTPEQKIKSIKSKQEVPLIRCIPDSSWIALEPVVASGNWRNIIRYDFSLQSKVAFQGSDYNCTIKIRPSKDVKANFTIYNASVFLVQKYTYSNSSVSFGSQSNTVLLFRSTINANKNSGDPLESGFSYNQKVSIPTYKDIQFDAFTGKLVKFQPSFAKDSELGFSCTHSIRVSFEISENNQDASTISTEIPMLESMSVQSEQQSFSDQSVVEPPRTSYKEGLKRYQNVELSFSNPVTILSAQSVSGSDSPPVYVNGDVESSEYSHSPSSYTNSLYASDILPPTYDECL